jgi:hypothetical protein
MIQRLRKKYAPTIYEVLVLAAMRKSGVNDVDVMSACGAIVRFAKIDAQYGTTMTVLRRLQRAGYVTSRKEKKRGSSRNGESIVFFSLTEEGLEKLNMYLDQIVEMI